jgi:hypothetical protein
LELAMPDDRNDEAPERCKRSTGPLTNPRKELAMAKAKISTIETAYNGVTFRSRTEARWAVFFDAAGIPWQYEPEGFEFCGERYVPDFWLPREQTYFEVKGELPALDTLDRLYRFSSVSGERLLLAIDSPCMEAKVSFIDAIFERNDFTGQINSQWGWLAEDRKDENAIWLLNDEWGAIMISPAGGSDRYPVTYGRFEDAYEKAKNHRFDWK